MIKIVIMFAFLVLGAVGCNQGGGSSQGGSTSQGGGTNQDVQNKTVQQLKKEVLDVAGACSEEHKKQREKIIEKQSKILNEAELKNSLRNMKSKIKC